MDRPLLLHLSFASGLVGGVLVIVATILMLMMMTMMGGTMGDMMPMMHPMPGDGFMAMGLGMLGWSAVVGTTMLVAALRVKAGGSPMGWGVAMIVAGVVSFPVMGGFLVGALAGIAAGTLAIVAATPAPAQSPRA